MENNNITKTIKESLEEFDKHVPPPPSFSDIQEIIHAWGRMQPPENYTATEAMMAENEWNRRMAAWKQIKSHLLQSQIKVIEAVIEHLLTSKTKEESPKKYVGYIQYELGYDQALQDQIFSLNETLEELKKSL